MTAQRDQAIVLRLTEFSESSQIVTLFGHEGGLLRLIAKGVRRSTKTRFATGLDLLEYGEVGYIPARGDAQLGTQTDWTQRDTFLGLRRELLRVQAGLYAIELVNALTEEGDPHPELFQSLLRFLKGLAGETNPGPAIPWFQAELLKAIGYAPLLDECVSCHRPIPPAALTFFSAGAGGLLCRDCEGQHAEKRRLPSRLLETTPATGGSFLHWFELYDYHLTHLAGRRPHTSAALAKCLHQAAQRQRIMH